MTVTRSISDEKYYPIEDFVTTSSSVVWAGLYLVFSVAALGFVIYHGRGKRGGAADLFGFTVTIPQVESAYRTSWAPSHFLPKKSDHVPMDPDLGGSVVYVVVWMFLVVWMLMTGIFFILCGSIGSIEIYREEMQLRSSIFVCVSLILCAIWTVVVRIGSSTEEEKRGHKDRGDASLGSVAVARADNRNKEVYIEMATAVLVVAWLLSLLATVWTQAWTLPGNQYGMLVFVAPGYGILTGWLLYAASISFGVAYSARSYPDGVKSPPDGNTDGMYNASVLPVAVSVVLLVCATAIPDPAQPLPFVVIVLLFTPKSRENLLAVTIGVCGVVLGTFRIFELREVS